MDGEPSTYFLVIRSSDKNRGTAGSAVSFSWRRFHGKNRLRTEPDLSRFCGLSRALLGKALTHVSPAAPLFVACGKVQKEAERVKSQQHLHGIQNFPRKKKRRREYRRMEPGLKGNSRRSTGERTSRTSLQHDQARGNSLEGARRRHCCVIIILVVFGKPNVVAACVMHAPHD